MSNREYKKFMRGLFVKLALLNLVAFLVIVHFKAKEERELTTALAAPETTVEVTTEEQTTTQEPTTEEATTEEQTTEEQTTEAPKLYTAYDAELIGRTIWGEAGGVKSKAERAAVAWCILNRVDAWGISIEAAVTTPHQFYGYRPADKWGDCPQEHIDLATDVLERWNAEKNGATDVGRTLPSEYLYFLGDGERNHFTAEWKGTQTWDWSMTSPY